MPSELVRPTRRGRPDLGPPPRWPPPGSWIGASIITGRTIGPGEDYPHICGSSFPGRATGRETQLWQRDCPACPPPGGSS